jgi:glutathione synthase/RimK-type ligase-like ATP-grasp enzyme
MKFKHELRNGKAHHYTFDVDALKSVTTRLAQLIGIDVYGGDVIVDKNGLFYIIDFNDWPSFSRCKTEAAKAISQLIKERI